MVNPTDKDIQIALNALGKKLGMLLESSLLPLEVKQAWLDLIPEMSPEQIDELIKQLEDHFNSPEYDRAIISEKLISLKKDIDQKRQQAEDNFIKDINSLVS